MSQTFVGEMERFSSGDMLSYVVEGVRNLERRERRRKGIRRAVRAKYDVQISEKTGKFLKRIYAANDSEELVRAIQQTGLHEADDYTGMLPGSVVNSDEEPGLEHVMMILDTRLRDAHCPREKEAEDVSRKSDRSRIYIPELINKVGEDGTIFMAKSVTSAKKVKIAWDLHDDNEIIVVDDYEKWENLLGWEKLKNLPHGKNKIREQLGDRLSSDVLDEVTRSSSNSSSKSGSSSSSSKSSTPDDPKERVINLAVSNRQRNRWKVKAEKIKETLEDGETIGNDNIAQVILFPSTCEKNMTDHWWVPGKRGQGNTSAAIAVCKKTTYDYLKDCDRVWHIDEYLDAADDYEFVTSEGTMVVGDVEDFSNFVFHTTTEESFRKLNRECVLPNMPEALVEYADRHLYRSPTLPHKDDMVYAPITKEDVFWMKPVLVDMTANESDGLILIGGVTPKNVQTQWRIDTEFKLYALARLPDWDHDATELQSLKSAHHSLSLDRGGFEVIETLAKLHDDGDMPYSVSPQSRWEP